MPTAWFKLIVGFLIWSGALPLVAAEDTDDPDLQLLKARHIPTDGESLLAYLRKLSPKDLEPEQIDNLVRQLGDKDFRKREQASKDLDVLGYSAITALRNGQTSSDQEIVRRAKVLLEKIEEQIHWTVPRTVVRRLLRLRPPGTAEALLAFLPCAEKDEDLQEEIWYGLDALLEGRKTKSVLVAALKDSWAARRALAACILGRIATAEQRADVRKLLQDKDAHVRLRAAQGLLAGKDGSGIPTLIGLLKDAPTYLAWQAEELLHWAAGDNSPQGTIAVGTPEHRRKCHQEWEKWWLKSERKLDFQRLDKDHRRPGLLLVWEAEGVPNEENARVWFYGSDGNPRWEINNLNALSAVRILPHSRLLIAEYYAGRVSLRDLSGNIIWAQAFPGPCDCQSFPNGETLFADNFGDVLKLTAGGTKEFYRRVFLTPSNRVDRARIQANGRLIGWRAATKDQSMVFNEIDPVSQQTLRTLSIQPSLAHGTQAIPAKDGQIFLSRRNRLLQVDSSGKLLRETNTWRVHPSSVVSLRNGNLLVAGLVRNWIGVIAEINANGNAVWQMFFAKRVCFQVCMGLVRFGLNQPRPDLDLNSVDNSIQDLSSRNTLSRWVALDNLAIYGPKAEKAIPAVIEAFDDPDVNVSHYAASVVYQIGPAAIPYLGKALKDKRSRIRAAAASQMGTENFWRECKPFLPDLINALKDEDNKVRWSAATSLGSFRSAATEAVPVLVAALKDQDRNVAWSAARSLERLGPVAKPGVTALVELLKSNDTKLGMTAARILARFGPDAAPSLPALRQVLSASRHAELRGAVALALARVAPQDPATVAILLEAFRNKKCENGRAHIAKALGELGPGAATAIRSLIEALKDNDEDLKESAAEALGKIGPAARDAVPALVNIFEDKKHNKDLRQKVAQSLGKMGEAAKAAIPALTEAKDDPDEAFNWEVRRALRRLHGIP